MGTVSHIIVTVVNVGCLFCGLYCLDKYFSIWHSATTSMHEITGTLFGIGAILSFGILSISVLLNGIHNKIESVNNAKGENSYSSEAITRELEALNRNHDNSAVSNK